MAGGACQGSSRGRARPRLGQPPITPITKLTIDLKGGKQGLLVNSANLCAKKRRAKLNLTAQNGIVRRSEPVVKTSCKKPKPGKGKSKKR